MSIHADSTAQGEDASKHGFHMIIPSLPIPEQKADAAQSGGGLEASTMMRDAYKSDGFVPANYAGVNDGLQTRADVAGPALTQIPLVFVEMGNGSNKEDSAQLESTDGQLKHAITITTGIVTYLLTGSDSAPAEELAAAPAATTTPEASEDSASSTTTTTPKATTPKATPKSTTPESAEFSELMEMLAPLLEVEGLDGLQDLVNDKNLGLVSDLASTLMAVITGAGGN